MVILGHIVLWSSVQMSGAAPVPGADPGADSGAGTPSVHIVQTHEMNPEEPREIEGWWSDGTRLLELRVDGRFQIWPTLDRFLPCSDVGRWHRENHAVFWLDSYRIPRQPRQRVPLWLSDGSLMATLDPDEAPFSRMLVAPSIPAESIMGTWICGDHRLRFDRNLRWNHRVGRIDAATPVRRDEEDGTWRMGLDGTLRMVPSTPQPPPITRLIRNEEGRLVGLDSEYGVFVRATPSPKIDESNPGGPGDEGVQDTDRSPVRPPKAP